MAFVTDEQLKARAKDAAQPKWMGRPISKDEDVHDLETRAAIHEFGDKLPRQEAEEKAYGNYLRDKRLEGAAHHLAGMKAAQGAGQMDEARRHGDFYSLHLKALGLNPVGPVPPEVQAKLSQPNAEKLYRFRGHNADQFAVGESEPPKEQGLEKAEHSCSWRLGERRCHNPGSREAAGRWWCHHHERHGSAVEKKLESKEKLQKTAAALLHEIYKIIKDAPRPLAKGADSPNVEKMPHKIALKDGRTVRIELTHRPSHGYMQLGDKKMPWPPGLTAVRAFDENGEHIGNATFSHHDNGETMSSDKTFVAEPYRRQGLATHMYDIAQRYANKKVVQTSSLLDDGKAFWDARKTTVPSVPQSSDLPKP